MAGAAVGPLKARHGVRCHRVASNVSRREPARGRCVGRRHSVSDSERQGVDGEPSNMRDELPSRWAHYIVRPMPRVNCRAIPRISTQATLLGGRGPLCTRIPRVHRGAVSSRRCCECREDRVRPLATARRHRTTEGVRACGIVAMSVRRAQSCVQAASRCSSSPRVSVESGRRCPVARQVGELGFVALQSLCVRWADCRPGECEDASAHVCTTVAERLGARSLEPRAAVGPMWMTASLRWRWRL